MAWLTREDVRDFTRLPQEPDMDTLTYWVQRLEPVIRNERNGEIIVIFCNRTGIEEDIVYAGTSAVIGIKDGEVSVYGLLGRGVKDLLVVDTTVKPFAKLVQRPEPGAVETESNGRSIFTPSQRTQLDPTNRPPGLPSQQSSSRPSAGSQYGGQQNSNPPMSQQPKVRNLKPLKIPSTGSSLNTSSSPIVETPTAPSPTPQAVRPKFLLPVPFNAMQKPEEDLDRRKSLILGGHVAINEDLLTPMSFMEENSPGSVKYFWTPPQSLLGHRREMTQTRSSEIGGSTTFEADSNRLGTESGSKDDQNSSEAGLSVGLGISASMQRPDSRPFTPSKPSLPKSGHASRNGYRGKTESGEVPEESLDWGQLLEAFNIGSTSALDRSQPVPNYARPESPKSRNASRSRPTEMDIPISLERGFDLPGSSIPITASPSIVPLTQNGPSQRPPSAAHGRPGSRRGHRPGWLAQDRSSSVEQGYPGKSRSSSWTRPAIPALQSSLATEQNLESNKANGVQEPRHARSSDAFSSGVTDNRAVSRGRQPGIKTSPSNASHTPNTSHVRTHSDQGHREARKTISQNRRQNAPSANSIVSQGFVDNGHPDDIVATIGRVCHTCPVHGQGPDTPERNGDNFIYEVNLPSHMRELLESSESPMPAQTSTRSAARSRVAGTPHFDPPTPKAMVFTPDAQPKLGSVESMERAEAETANTLDLAYETHRPVSSVW
jgi:hypothetical protein